MNKFFLFYQYSFSKKLNYFLKNEVVHLNITFPKTGANFNATWRVFYRWPPTKKLSID